MALTNPHLIYQQNAVDTASPERLLMMLFDGAIRFMNQAKVYLHNKDLEKAHINLVKAQDIFTELMATLDMRYEISTQLSPLYEYCRARLIEANMKKLLEPVDEVLVLTVELKQTWNEAIKMVKSSAGIAK